MFTDGEMDKCLREIVAGSYLSELQKEGIIDSIEGEDNEERFFLTDFGKKVAKEVEKREKKSKKGKKST
jgi:predicted transcriptional regulator